ncbi:MAG: hypothetical protein AAFY36_04590 [Bacteroidota bacterium]
MQEKTKRSSTINWRYILTELVLLVVGILLAINLNNWASNRKIKNQTKLSVDQIREEIKLNIDELTEVIDANRPASEFYSEISTLSANVANVIRCSPEKMTTLKKIYGDQFVVVDSVSKAGGAYEYELDIDYALEYGELNDIAWRTAQLSTNMNEYGYDCLKSILSVYGFQELYTNVQTKFLDYKILRDKEEFIATFQLNHRMGNDLLERYLVLAEEIEECGL